MEERDDEVPTGSDQRAVAEPWPPLELSQWVDTRETLHLWTQVVGKIKLELCPFVNQWWEVALSLNARGLSSGLIPSAGRSFEISFELIEHRLRIAVSDGDERSLALEPRSVADFHERTLAALSELGIDVAINSTPSEVEDPIPFEQDSSHASYDADAVARWWRAMLAVERVIQRFRTGFGGKSSPVLFYWGGFDLNHTRFNGRPIDRAGESNPILRFGENEENFSIGFWPGSREQPNAVLYAYASPAPEGIAQAAVEPAAARFVEALGEFVLPYEVARALPDPDAAALSFFRSAYERSVALAGWDRSRLEEAVPDLGSAPQ